jgi:hypothetical protein
MLKAVFPSPHSLHLLSDNLVTHYPQFKKLVLLGSLIRPQTPAPSSQLPDLVVKKLTDAIILTSSQP